MPPFFEVNPQFRPPRPAANARVDTPWNCRRSSSPVWVWRCGHIRIAGVGTHVVQLRHWLCPCALAPNRASSRLKRCGSSRKGAWPYDQYGSVERELIHDSGNVVGPFVAIGVLFGLRRCVRHAVTAQVERDDAKLVLQHSRTVSSNKDDFATSHGSARLGFLWDYHTREHAASHHHRQVQCVLSWEILSYGADSGRPRSSPCS
jgi:hypothetical protein